VKESNEVLAEVRAAASQALAERDPAQPFDREIVGALVKTAVRRFIKQRFQRKPIVLPVILEVASR
jgi:hypothetical protein